MVGSRKVEKIWKRSRVNEEQIPVEDMDSKKNKASLLLNLKIGLKTKNKKNVIPKLDCGLRALNVKSSLPKVVCRSEFGSDNGLRSEFTAPEVQIRTAVRQLSGRDLSVQQ